MKKEKICFRSDVFIKHQPNVYALAGNYCQGFLYEFMDNKFIVLSFFSLVEPSAHRDTLVSKFLNDNRLIELSRFDC